MKPNIPTMLTWLRILLIPVFVGAFYWPENLHKLSAMPSHWVNVFATSVFAIAAITDWLDGYLARRLNQTSSFGAFLDPVADKLMVAAALIVLVEFGRVGAIVSLIIIGREIAISALREWMAGEGGVGRFVEVGAGKQLSGMVKRNAPDAETMALNEPADLEAFAKSV